MNGVEVGVSNKLAVITHCTRRPRNRLHDFIFWLTSFGTDVENLY